MCACVCGWGGRGKLEDGVKKRLETGEGCPCCCDGPKIEQISEIGALLNNSTMRVKHASSSSKC